MKNIIFTLGHSNHDIQKFIDLLNVHNITAVCDVRSSPFSKYSEKEQFNRLDRLSHENESKQVLWAFSAIVGNRVLFFGGK